MVFSTELPTTALGGVIPSSAQPGNTIRDAEHISRTYIVRRDQPDLPPSKWKLVLVKGEI